jgi:hypothetical protein
MLDMVQVRFCGEITNNNSVIRRIKLTYLADT